MSDLAREETRAGRDESPDRVSGEPSQPVEHADLFRAASAHGNAAVARWVAANNASGSGAAVISRFGSREHQQIGASGSGGAATDIDLGGGEMLPYGDMVALAGDYFTSLEEMRTLASTPDGQAELRGARWKALGIGSPPTAAVLQRVNDRYFRLAGANISHFSGGGDARSSYEAGHTDALTQAFMSGSSGDERKFQAATTSEAFSNHFLTDMFASGHVRTPRREIKEWYQNNYPDSLDRLLDYASNRIASILDEWHQTNGIPNGSIADKIQGKIRALGGSAVDTFSLGDIISLAYHNQDNKGLNVVSQVNAEGQEVAGGFHWRAEGDDHLIPPGGAQPDADAQLTERMATAAVRASLAELETARERGRGAGTVPADQLLARAQEAVETLKPFRAERFVPSEDPAANNVQMDWHWNSLDPVLHDAVDEAVKGAIVGTLRDKAGQVPELIYLKWAWDWPPIVETPVASEASWTLHTRDAFNQWVGEMASQGIGALQTAMAGATPQMPTGDAGVSLPGGLPEGGVPDPVAGGTGGSGSGHSGDPMDAGVGAD